MAFVCLVTLPDHVIKVFYDFLVKSPSRYTIVLQSLVAIDTVILDI